MNFRRPRFRRIAVAPIQLTERDIEIIRHVHRHRFLRSSQIAALVGGSRQQVLRRLQLLYHHGYLERPRMQIEFFLTGGSHHMVYGLGDEAAAILEGLGIGPNGVRYNEKNHAVGRFYLHHTLFVSEIMVAIELACRESGQARLLYGEDVPFPNGQLPRWKVTVDGIRLNSIPDRIFALEPADGGNRTYFFLEADRGTMPVIRNGLAQSSFYRKLIAYEATWSQGLHRSLLGIDRFRVVTVTTSGERVRSLVEACSQLKRGRGLFLFADPSILSEGILTAAWQTGRQGETAQLVG